MNLDHSMGIQYCANLPVTIDVQITDKTSGLMGHSQLTTINQSELSTQLGLSLGGGTILPPAQSPEDCLSNTPSPTSSLHEDGVEDLQRLPSRDRILMPTLERFQRLWLQWDSLGEVQKQVNLVQLLSNPLTSPDCHSVSVAGGSSSSCFYAAASTLNTAPSITTDASDPNSAASYHSEAASTSGHATDSTSESLSQFTTATPLQNKTVPPPTLNMQTTLVPPAMDSSLQQPRNSSPEAHAVEATSPETICVMITDILPKIESPSQMGVELVSGFPVTFSPQPRCVRSGCENPVIVSKDWDNECCNDECLVKHCRDVFLAWVALGIQTL
ncbi:TOX high mobility group box family member 4 [Sciurus carolinensis]|uniref:TOX high mobility group box family member 4 n=1 Tax=Sciurus carolinensis TaxID=30640 RepID=A0AA41NKR5_SCICA|nr:TOX high mobility group box family member 4 [Sciurus carolinensis]